MNNQIKHSINNNYIIRILFPGILILYFLVSCSNEKKDYINMPFDRDSIPIMQTDSVTTLISDSGIIRYKVTTAEWLYFDNTTSPHWFFPKGIYVEKFDSLFRKEVTIKADTAWNYLQKHEWKLKGNVLVKNTNDETIKTEELNWNEEMQLVYSSKYVEINRPGKMTLQGIGFQANQSMTDYKIFNPFDSPFYIEDEATQ